MIDHLFLIIGAYSLYVNRSLSQIAHYRLSHNLIPIVLERTTEAIQCSSDS